jgi:hypothetical protein
MKKTMLVPTLFIFAAGGAFAVENPWIGTWKLDAAHSQLAGDTFTVTHGPGKLLHFTDGVIAFDFGTDGKEYKAAYDRTIVWTPTGPNSWETVNKKNGAVLTKSERTLSADGNTLSRHYTETHADGSTSEGDDVYARLSGGPGLLGTWKSIKVTDSGGPKTFIISAPTSATMRFEIPEWKAHAEGAVDGRDLPVVGDTTPAGMTASFKLVTPTQLKYVLKVNGKEDTEGVQTLAADGRTYTDVSWSPGKESEKQTCLYVRQ